MRQIIRIADLCCGAGAASVGYHRAFAAAGYDVEITGVDIAPQKHYPYRFIQADALTFPLDGFDFVHASPPCQDWSVASNSPNGPIQHGTKWMLPAIESRLRDSMAIWVVENVSTAKMCHPTMLCGSMFGLNVVRHRLFDSSHLLFPPGRCHHTGQEVSVCGNGTPSWYRQKHHRNVGVAEWKSAMGIDWMNRKELSQAIPPAYTEFIGRQIAAVLEREAA